MVRKVFELLASIWKVFYEDKKYSQYSKMDTERMPMTVQADWTGRRGERMCVCSCTIIMIPPALESLVKHEEQKLLIRSTLLDSRLIHLYLR